jgi:signal transduction histidine kinase
LLGNAIKFSPNGSRVVVAATREGDMAHFSVRDQGRGIPQEKLESIFQRFEQVDVSDAKHKGGTGLGLPIARSIIRQHGGSIWAESQINAGSTFHFTLPIRG